MVPLAAVLVSLLAAALILASSRRPNLREFWTLAAAAAKFGLVFSLLPRALAGRAAETVLFDISPGVRLALRADALGVFFALLSSGLWIVTSVYSIGYMRGLEERRQTRYFASFAVCLSAAIGIAFAANLLTFILFYEILTIATYPLVVHKETPEAVRAGRKYLAYTLTAGVMLLAGAAIVYGATGSLEFAAGGMPGLAGTGAGTIKALFILFLAGVGVKAAVMPLHGWLPTAMIAPTPVSALLHAVAVVKAGVFAALRLVGFVFGPRRLAEHGLDTFLLALAGVTVVLASLLAFKQDNLKRRLAYSTIGHLSYILLGAALLDPAAYTGAVMHMAFHATLKITLFFCAGAIYVRLHRENISELDGVGRVMPWTMAAFTIGAIGLAGIPPLNGFVSKWYLGLGAAGAGKPAALLLLVGSGLLNAGYFFPIVLRAYFKPGTGLEGKREASPLMVVPLVATAGLSIVFGLWPDFLLKFFSLARAAASAALGVGP
jgi:multicomponent Na+:H+ antiporter subunit D